MNANSIFLTFEKFEMKPNYVVKWFCWYAPMVVYVFVVYILYNIAIQNISEHTERFSFG